MLDGLTDKRLFDALVGEQSSTCSIASRASRARHTRQRAEQAKRILFSIYRSSNTTFLWIVFNSSIKLPPIIDTSCKPLLPRDCLHCLKTPTNLSNSTNLPWYSSRLDSSVTIESRALTGSGKPGNLSRIDQ